MTRIIPSSDMTAEQVVKCVVQARAIIGLCARSAWSDIQNGGGASDVAQAAEDIHFVLELANELLAPAQDALERHEGVGGAS